jgi:hypothetical protein
MKSTVLVCLRRNEMGLYIADVDINSVAAYLYLKKSGVEVKQYYNNVLISAEDIVEDLLSEYMDTVCFIVTKENRDFVYGIGHFFTENEDDTELVFLLTEDGVGKIPFGENMIGENISEKMFEYFECNEKIKIHELSVGNIYREKIVPVSKVSSLGIILNAKSFLFDCVFQNKSEDVMEELFFLTKYISYHNHIILYSDDLKEYRYQQELTEKMQNTSFQQTIQLRDISKIKVSCVENQYHAIKNGIRAFNTGMYYDAQEMAYAKHIRCEVDEISDQLLKSLSAHNAANSGIYVKGQNSTEKHEEIKKMALKSGFLLSNIVTYNELDVADKYDVKINGTDVGTYQTVSYLDAKELDGQNVYVSLDSEASLNEFIEDVEEYRSTGNVKYNRMWKYDCIDNCRWIGFKSCSLDKLYRFDVKGGDIYPCLSCNESIGKATDMHFTLIRNACVRAESSQIERNCEQCESKLFCPKCSMLSNFLTKERYCEIICSGLQLEQYFHNMMTIRTFFEYCSIKKLKGIAPDMMEYTTDHHTITIEQESTGNCRLHEYIMLGKVKGQDTYIIFNWRMRQAISVNKSLFMVAELLYMGCNNDIIHSYLAKLFEVTEEEVKTNVEEYLNFFMEKGFIVDEY